MQTGDGYLLGLHRLGWRKGEEGLRVTTGDSSTRKPVVYLHHGLLMNSEVWVCLTEEERCLPLMLVEKGYDVWVSHLECTNGVFPLFNACSWAITEATSILRSQHAPLQAPMRSGISQWINSPSMTFLTASITSLRPQCNLHYPTSDFRKAQLKLSLLCQSIRL